MKFDFLESYRMVIGGKKRVSKAGDKDAVYGTVL